MKALILNSGTGSRMGAMTREHPKCMTELREHETILSRQLKQLADLGVHDVVITTGGFHEAIVDYCRSLGLQLSFTFVRNDRFECTNYIFSMDCARDELQDDILLMHGDLVMEPRVLEKILNTTESCMAVSSSQPLPQKDFKAVIEEGRIRKVGIEFFDHALSAQPLYYFLRADMQKWLRQIHAYCEQGKTMCYAENALNELTDELVLKPCDIGNWLCEEIDTPEDWKRVRGKVQEAESRTVYMCFSTDILHAAHLRLIRRAARLGRVVIGVLSDEAVISYKRFPLLNCEERMEMFRSIQGVWRVVEQKTLSYKENLERWRPNFVVHGDDWKENFQKPVREEVIRVLERYGGELVEYPYTRDPRFHALENTARAELAMPDMRRGRLRRILAMKGYVIAMEAHSGMTGLIVENTLCHEPEGGARQFDAMWVSSLCDSISRGKPDIELVDLSSRFRTIDEIMDVTTKPIIFDGDTGGLIEHFVYTVRTLERMGVSMVIIEDKTGLKKNSLFGTEVPQEQDSIEHFCQKIRAGKRAQKTDDFMICARIESLILDKGLQDAMTRGSAYVEAGADAVMIHSRKSDPREIFMFLEKFHQKYPRIPLVVVPSSYSQVTEEELREHGAGIVIYANQLTRAGFPAMQETADSILKHHRAKESEDRLLPIRDIIRLIPEEL